METDAKTYGGSILFRRGTKMVAGICTMVMPRDPGRIQGLSLLWGIIFYCVWGDLVSWHPLRLAPE